MIRRAPDSEIDRIFATTRASRSCGRSAGSAPKDVLAFLTACCQAQLDGTRAPSLFAAA